MTLQQDPQRNESKYLHKFVDFAVQHVLEIGCGEGRLTWQYAKEAHYTIGIDIDADALRVAMIDKPYDLLRKVHFAHAESEHLPFPKEAFEVVVLAWSF